MNLPITDPSASHLVSTDRGVGFWDAARRELRLARAVHVSPVPQRMRPVTDLEIELFFAIRYEQRKRAAEYYNGRGKRWSGD